jgi:alanine dehydrogenase
MPAIYLTEADVRRLLDMRQAVDLVENAFHLLAAGELSNVPRTRAVAPGIVLHTMSSAAPCWGLAAWKAYATTRDASTFHMGLYDLTGRLIAVVEADYLGQLRTGATTAVAVEWMAAPEASDMGLFGTGKQARTQLAAVAAVRPLKRAFVYSRDAARRTAFANQMSADLNLEVIPVDRPQEAASDLPLVVTATASRQPVFDGDWLAEGSVVCAIGSNWLNRAEIDAAVVRRADNIVCDSVEACRREAGDFVDALDKGSFDWSQAVDLCEVVAGRATARNSRESIGLFKSVGLAIEDLALGHKLLELARSTGAGTPLPF